MNLIAPTLADYPIRAIEKLRFADTDRNGHITNSVYAVCCQNARMELLCDPRRVPVPSNTQLVVARLLLEFRAEMHWPGIVDIGTRIDRIGRCSVTLSQGLFVGGQCVATSESVVVLIDATRRRSTPLPLGTIEALRAIAPPDSGCSSRVAKVQRPKVSSGLSDDLHPRGTVNADRSLTAGRNGIASRRPGRAFQWVKPMCPRPASEEPVVSVAHRPPDEPGGGASLRTRTAVLALARLIGRQIAREQYAIRHERKESTPASKPEDR